MDLISALPIERRKSARELSSFRDQESDHFDDCVKQGLMTPEERNSELEILHSKVNSTIRKIILKQ